jgi:hypothetical protein
MEGSIKLTEVLAIVLAMLRDTLAILSSIAKGADLPALVFLVGMAELEAVQAEAYAKHEAVTKE